ncbi:MED14-domain-containing protein [Eremomyces bilateralis CBS 781.70]|uniref:Mediator of RNA polymerase II transcription subunit 14 n=1 Tax=Eremomyces bilateralis CBS 781.70 TaxID=1392243 RepID=A0A6G1G0C9_9PEZI|nr:MED14-domain-containing protein [Eremomyces bilateralis CBS 781.70]KAF1811269.1 MED14-domain-containing protein [Eremomyces bilateralis CBS 781.70]
MDNQPNKPPFTNGGSVHALPESSSRQRDSPQDSGKASNAVQLDSSANASARNGPSSSDLQEHEPSMSELPPELQHITFTMQPLGKLVARVAQIASNELHEALDKMAELPPVATPSSTPNGTNGLANGMAPSSHQPENNSPANQQRKEIMFEYAEKTRNRFIQLLVLSVWSRSSADVSKMIDVVNFLRTQEAAQEQASFALGQLKLDIHPFKLPAPDIQTALETLTTGTTIKTNKLDKAYLPPPELSAEYILKTLRNLNVLLHERILVGIGLANLPPMLQKWRIRNGRVTFIVPGEFELDVGVAEEEPDPVKARWWFVDVRWNFQPSASVPQAARGTIEAKINQELGIAWNALVEREEAVKKAQESQLEGEDKVAADPTSILEVDRSCLKRAYDFLHNFILTHKVSVLRKQAFDLVMSSWAGTLRVEMAHRNLILQYWTQVPGPKSWLEIALHSKRQRRKDPKTGATLLFWDWRGPQPSTIGIRWMRLGKEMDVKDLAKKAGWNRKQIEERNIEAEICGFGDLRTLDVENALNRTVSMHALWIFESIRDKLLESQDGSRMLSVEMSVETMPEKPGAASSRLEKSKNPLIRPKLTLRLGPSSPTCRLQMDTISGTLLLTPRVNPRIQFTLSTLPSNQIPIVSHTHLRRHAALALLSHLGLKASHAGWIKERNFRASRESVKTQINLARQNERKRWDKHGIPLAAIWASESQQPQGNIAPGAPPAALQTLKGPDFLYSTLVRPPQWGRTNWAVLMTVTIEEAERFWAVELTNPVLAEDVKYAVPLYPIQDPDIERLGKSFWRYLEKVALGAIGSVVLGRQLSERSVRFNWFPEGIPDRAAMGSNSGKSVSTPDTSGLTPLQKASVPMLFVCFQDLLFRDKLPFESEDQGRVAASPEARKERKAARRRDSVGSRKGSLGSTSRKPPTSSSMWAISALRFQFLDLAISGSRQPMPVYAVTGMFSRDNPVAAVLSHPKYRASVPDIHTALDVNPAELPTIHVTPKGTFALYLRTKFGESPFGMLVNRINSLALLRDFVTTLDRKGLGSQIRSIDLDSISFAYGELIRRRQSQEAPIQEANETNGASGSAPGRGQLTPKELSEFSVSLRFDDPSEPMVLEFDGTNPHRRLRSQLSHLLHSAGPGAFSTFINALARTGPLMAAAAKMENNAMVSSAHSSSSSASTAPPNPTNGTPSTTVSPYLTIHTRSVDNVRFSYTAPRCLLDARLRTRRGSLEWVFEKVGTRAPPRPQSSAAGAQRMQPAAPSEEELRVTRSLDPVFSGRGSGWQGMRTAVVAELEGVGEVVERLDECVRVAGSGKREGEKSGGGGKGGKAVMEAKKSKGKPQEVIELD